MALGVKGDRVREYTNLEDPNNGITHGRDGDWVIERICQFSSPDTEERIVVCYCLYQPTSTRLPVAQIPDFFKKSGISLGTRP